MDDARELWSIWQSLLENYNWLFRRGSWVRFVQWVTALVLCDEEHTITQALTSIGLESRWRVLEHLAEYGLWDREMVERQTIRVVEQEQMHRWKRYRCVALDDTKEHRTSADVWGTCTFHESTARSPNRAETVRAHNWVVMGDLVPGKPWTYLPHGARLYFRRSQLPVGEKFRTKTKLAVDMLREIDAESETPILAVFDGAYANETVIRPCLNPSQGQRRIDVVTRPRVDARLYRPLVTEETSNSGGRPRKWGQRMAAPKNHEKWNAPWQTGRAFIYGRMRRFRYKRVLCQWAVTGPNHLVHVYVFEVEGYKKPWFIISTALDLSPSQVVAVFAARYRQEDGFRDHKQRLGMEECRAWTKEPILRTFQVQMIAMTLLRLMQFHLDEVWGEETWWRRPEWNPRKQHGSILDLRRLFWRQRTRFSKFMVRLEEFAKPPQAYFAPRRPTARAA
jgi:hypothetical protein